MIPGQRPAPVPLIDARPILAEEHRAHPTAHRVPHFLLPAADAALCGAEPDETLRVHLAALGWSGGITPCVEPAGHAPAGRWVAHVSILGDAPLGGGPRSRYTWRAMRPLGHLLPVTGGEDLS